jgi:PIN domain nuclease of toxin-antitoxin system
LRLLLDTHIVIWWAAGSSRLSSAARALIAAPDAELFVSAASWWELAIKRAIGRIDVDTAELRRALEQRAVRLLDVTFDHAEAAASLPAHHGDPFDRMLVAQSVCEGLRLLTRDERLSAYGSTVLAVS